MKTVMRGQSPFSKHENYVTCDFELSTVVTLII